MHFTITGLTLCLLMTAGTFLAATQVDELASSKLRIEWDEFKKLYDAKAVVVVDVRGADAFETGHIPAARSIPLADVERNAPALKKLGKPIVFYCA